MRTLLMLAAVGFLVSCHTSAENLVRNGGFEEGMSAWQWNENDKANATCELVSDVVHSGNGAIRITNKSKYAPGVYKRLYQPVSLKPDTKYAITAWSKGKDMGW